MRSVLSDLLYTVFMISRIAMAPKCFSLISEPTAEAPVLIISRRKRNNTAFAWGDFVALRRLMLRSRGLDCFHLASRGFMQLRRRSCAVGGLQHIFLEFSQTILRNVDF